jgi:hypothetical protein
MIVQERERYDIHFKAEPGKSKLYQCLGDKSLWLTKEEAVAHVLGSSALKEYYTVEEVDVGAPKGNFNAIAVCGMSGTLLGPSSHHEYQKNIVRLHQERFSNMPIDQLKSRIRMENDEETIEKWKEQVSKARHYRLKGEEEVIEEVVAETEEAPASEGEASKAATEVVADEAAATEESIVVEAEVTEEAVEEAAAEVSEEPSEDEVAVGEEGESEEAIAEEPAQEEASAPEVDEVVLKSPEELAQHFREHFAAEMITEVSEVSVPGNISGKDLSAGLLGYVKQEGEKLRRGFPLPMIQSLCREFEKHGMRFFKRGKKALHVSSIRPKAISAGVALSADVQKLVDYIIANPGRKVVDMLDSLVEDFSKPDPKADKSAPKEEVPLSDGAKKALSNLRWLTSEGYVLEFADTKLHIGKGPRPDQPASKKSTKKGAKKKVAKAQVPTEGKASPDTKVEAEVKVEAEKEVAPKAETVEAAKPEAAPAADVVEAEVPSEKASEPVVEEATSDAEAAATEEPQAKPAPEVAEPEVASPMPEEVEPETPVADEVVTDPSVEVIPDETESKAE